MKAAVLERLGTLPQPGDFAEPERQEGETIVTVTAAAIKPLDRAIAAGTHFGSPKALPVVCGTDGVGRLAGGERVYFTTLRRPFGAIAERAPAAWTVPLPDGVDDALAAAVVNPALAAWMPIQWRGRLAPGETVLVLGATGAAGRMAVTIARLLGAGKVIAAGRNRAVLDALPVDATIDLAQDEEALARAFAEHAADGIAVVIDYVWGRPVEILLKSLTRHDLGAANTPSIRLVSIGEMAGKVISLPSAALRGSKVEITGSGPANFPQQAEMIRIVGDLLDRAGRGEISVPVRRVPLAEVAAAWTSDDTAGRPIITLG